MRRYSSDPTGNLTSAASAATSVPQILTQPLDQIVRAGTWASFSVIVADTNGATFQWAFNGNDIPGEIGDSLVVSDARQADVGEYTVTVTNAVGTVTSTPASLSLDDGDAANGAAVQPSLTAYADLGGSLTVSPMKLSYSLGEDVTLTATSAPPSIFVGWVGLSPDELVTTNPVTVIMDGDKTVRARFAAAAAIPEGLVALWRADAAVTDVIGGHNGTFFSGGVAAAPAISASGITGDAFSFDGTTYIQVPDAVDLTPAAFTLEAWVFLAIDGGNTVIARGSATDNSVAWYLGVSHIGADFWSHGKQLLESRRGIPINRWTHVAATFDGSTKRLFINGVEVGAQGGLPPLTYAAEQSVPVTIGAGWAAGAPTAHFIGMLDEVGVYRRALTANEIFALADADLAGKDLASPYLVSDSHLPSVTVDASYRLQLGTVFGSPPVTFALTGGGLPPGLDLSPSGELSGQPTAAGTFGFSVQATDASRLHTERLYVLPVLTPIPPPSDLVGWWRGEAAADGSAHDSIGAHHGEFFSGAVASPPSYTPDGMVGEAFDLDGSNYIRVPDAPELRPSELTLEAWIYPTALQPANTLIARGSATDSTDMWQLSVAGGQPQFWSHGLHLLSGGPVGIPVNRWTHLAATFDGDTKRLYVDGVQIAAVGGMWALVYPNQSVPVTIGADLTSGAPDGLFTGTIDEVCLYRRALTPDEISAIVAAAKAGKSDSAPYITSERHLSAPTGIPFSHTVDSVLGTPPVSYSLSTDSALESGMTLSPGGVLNGTLTAAGVFDFTVRAIDAAGLSSAQQCTLQVLSSVDAPAGLVAWWRGEGDANDSAGSNDGSMKGGIGFAEGKVGQAFSLDSVNGYLEVPDVPGLRLTTLTMETWAIFYATTGSRVIVAKPAGGGTADSYALWLSSGTPMAVVGDPAGIGSVLASPTTLIPGRWYHLAYIVDAAANTQALYIDGLRVATSNLTKLPGYDAQPLLIGCDKENGQLNYFLNGRIDDIAIYNRALGYAEIMAIYHAGPAGKRTPP